MRCENAGTPVVLIMLVRIGMNRRGEALVEEQREITEIIAAPPTAKFDSLWGRGYVTGMHFTRMVLAGTGIIRTPATQPAQAT